MKLISSLFITVLNMNLTASFCILLVCAARLLMRRLPKLYSYVLWSVVGFRLLCPVSFESIFSLLKLNPAQSQGTLFSGTWAMLPGGAAPAMQNIQPLEGLYETTSQQIPAAGNALLPALTILWLSGFLIMGLYSLLSYIKLKRNLPVRTRMSIHPDTYELDSLDTPFVIGFLKPVICLPSGLTKQERAHILLHENIHIRRKDYLFKQLAYLCLCIHWFNPLVWAAFRLMTKDMEMSCDEKALGDQNTQERKAYSRTLLSFASGRCASPGSSLFFGEGNTASRIHNILSYRKPTLWISIVVIILVAVLSVGLMSNPRSMAANASPDGAQETVKAWADAFCDRDGQTLYELSADKDTFSDWDMVSLTDPDNNTFSFGYSSPWPWLPDYHYILEGESARIYYYAHTSDPAVSVWVETIQLTEEGKDKESGLLKVYPKSLEYYDQITTASQFNEAYQINGQDVYYPFDEQGFTEAIISQLKMQLTDPVEQPYASRNSLYQDYGSALELYLHLSGGTATPTDSRDLSDTSSLSESDIVNITYQFADGSSVTVPMRMADREYGIWTIANTP